MFGGGVMLNSKSNKIFWIISFVLGVIAGILITIYLFAIDVDLMGIPYINKGVLIKKPLTLKQNSITLIIPEGAELTLMRRMPGVNEYAIPIIIPWDDETKIEKLSTKSKPFLPKSGNAK
jgi:hypothetical protein